MSDVSSGATGAATVPAFPTRPARGRLQAVVATMRPRQWVKNALVVAAAGAAGALGSDDVPERVAVACLAFCLLSSGIYAVNDVRDRHEDRHHPRKCRRPVAAGELDPGSALALGFVLMIVGLVLCALVRPLLLWTGAGYLALTLTYTMVWRRLPVLDVVAVAGGFVLRAVAGGVAAPVALSRWFILVVTFSALFIAAGKRHAELTRSREQRTASRAVMRFYTEARLRLILTGSAACALFSYCVWAFELPLVDGFPWRPLSIVPFAACLARYGSLARAGQGESPEEVILRDRRLLAGGVAWLIVFALSVQVGS